MSAIETSEIRSSWGWFLTVGIVLMLLGAACILGSVASTFVTVGVLGWLLLVSAVVSLVQAFRTRNWSGFFLHLFSALFRGFTGYLLVRYPYAGELGLTLILASLFVVGGLFRAVGAGTVRFPLWGWSVFSGLISLMLGIVLLVGLPAASTWFIGFFIGIDLLVDGAALAAFATAIHRSPPIDAFKTA